MLAPEERERLLGAMIGVYVDASARDHAPVHDDDGTFFSDAFDETLDAAEEDLVKAVRTALSTIATLSGAGTGGAAAAALGGAELTMRALLMAGEAERLPTLLPGFAYLVTLPALGEPQAARLAERVRTRVEEAM